MTALDTEEPLDCVAATSAPVDRKQRSLSGSNVRRWHIFHLMLLRTLAGMTRVAVNVVFDTSLQVPMGEIDIVLARGQHFVNREPVKGK